MLSGVKDAAGNCQTRKIERRFHRHRRDGPIDGQPLAQGWLLVDRLQSHEKQGGTNRINRLKAEIAALRTAEVGLQKQYGELVVEKRRLQVVTNVDK